MKLINPIHKISKKSWLSLIVLQTFIFSILIIIFTVSSYYQKIVLAQQITNTLEVFVKSGDVRRITQTLAESQFKYFKYVKLKNATGREILSFPNQSNDKVWSFKSLLYTQYEIPVYYDLEQKNRMASFVFTFEYYSIALIGLGLLLLGVMLTVPIFNRYNRLIRISMDKENAERESQFIKKLVKQVRHDYASPMMALEMLAHRSKTLVDSDRDMIQKATKRINGIFEDLSEKKIKRSQEEDGRHRIESINESILEILGEKRVQIKGEDISFHTNFSEEFLRAAIIFNETSFKRILSNIIQNSIEAIESKGRVLIKGETLEDKVKVSIKDNGKGINPSDLSRVGQEGFTVGKAKGQGLGLYSAKLHLHEAGGGLKISSVLGEGTEIELWWAQAKNKI